MKRICLAVWCGILLGGCASQPPRWAGSMWQAQNRLYFTGSSSSCQTVSCAYADAYQQALGSIAQYLNSQISVHTVGRLDNGGCELEVNTEIITRQIELEKVQVEEFSAIKQAKKQIGFILVSVDQQTLAAAEQKIKEQEQKRLRRQQQVFRLAGKRELVSMLQARLQERGFKTGKQGKTILVTQVKTACTVSRLQPVWTNTTLMSVQVENQKAEFSGKGYGLTCADAYPEALQKAVGQIIDWIEEML